MKERMRNTKGITLIALVITIIVLIILAGITIGTLTGDKSVIKEARSAKELTERSALEEQIEAAIIVAEQKHRNPTLDQVIEEIKKIETVTEVNKENGDIENILGDPITGKLDDYLGKVSTGDGDNTGGGDNNGDGDNTGGGTTTPTKTEVGELTAGEYVNYVDANGTTRKCIVLYDSTSSYGIQIIMAESPEKLKLGTGLTSISNSATDLSKAMSAYNVAITTLNTRAKAYLNPTYATSARCVGSVPNSPNTEATTKFTTGYSYLSTYNGKLMNTDTNYEKDWEQIQKLELQKVVNGCWLASRIVQSSASSSSFSLRYIQLGGSGMGPCCVFAINSSKVTEVWPGNQGVNPVFTLKTTLKITGGAGTDEEPYILGE